MKTKALRLSQKEFLKSLRDALLIAASALIPKVLELLMNTDFGEYTGIVTLVCMMITPVVNRFFNIARV